MHLNEEQINEIREMAKLFFSPDDIALNIGMEPEEFKLEILSGTGEVFSAFKQGWLQGEIPLRKSIARAAENGSNPAQMKMLDLKKESELKLEL
jgi:hypothetical protein